MTSLHELSALLLREREVLRLILAAVADADADQEREALLRSITSLELHRAIAARAVAVEMGMDREPTLRGLVERAPSDWAAVLHDHLGALQALIDEISAALRRSSDSLLRDGNVIAMPAPAPGLQRSLLEFVG